MAGEASGVAARPSGARRLLVIGGSADHLGGVEAFCERSQRALAAHGGWQVERIAASTAYLSARRLPDFTRGLVELVRARRRRPDVVWLQYVNLPDLAYLVLARLLGMRVMVTPHLGSNWRSQVSPLLRRLSGWALRLADRLALISWTQEEEIILPASVPRSLIRNFLPPEVLDGPSVPGDAMPPELQLIHSSRLSEGKGTFLVVAVCARLRDLGVPFHARITGGADEPTMTRLHALIAEHGVEGHVSVLGRVPEPELLDHLRRADVLVHLSKIDSYPLIVLEATACSAIAVVMELAGARDMVETYGGHVVGRDDPVPETADWLAALDVPALRAQRRSVAAQVCEDYAWPRCAAALAAALGACASGDRTVVTRPAPVA